MKDRECRECKCGHWKSSHKPAGCQEKTDTSCHAWGCDCEKFKEKEK